MSSLSPAVSHSHRVLVTESVLCCPRLSVSGSVLRSSLTEAACSHKTVFKGERSAPCLRSPSAMSVPLVRDSCFPGAIRSQAEGGMSLTSKSQTGQREEKKHARAQHSTHACTFSENVLIYLSGTIHILWKHIPTRKKVISKFKKFLYGGPMSKKT